MSGGTVCRGLLRVCVSAVLLLATGAASGQETLRPQPRDEASTPLPPGWKAIDRAVYDAYSTALATGRTGQAAGVLQRASYRLKLEDDASLTGSCHATISLTGDPGIVSLGKPNFAMSSVELDGQTPIWGCDARGGSQLFCSRDAGALTFQCSLQGSRRPEAIEFSVEWLTAVATQLELTVPAGQLVEAQGLLKTGQRTEPDGSVTATYEAGPRPGCTLRFRSKLEPTEHQLGVELQQTLSATPSKVLLQSIVGVVSSTSAPAIAEFELPPGYTLSRATLGGEERLPIDSLLKNGVLSIPLGDLAAGQQVELRLVLERGSSRGAPKWNAAFGATFAAD
jgi:hypothetical protein